MIVASGLVLAAAIVLLVAGILGPSVCLYASIMVSLVAVVLLPVGIARRGASPPTG